MNINNRQDIPLEIIPCLTTGFSFLRLAHILPQLGIVSVYLNDIEVMLENYLDFSPYFPVVPGNYNLRFYSPLDNTLLFEIKNIEIQPNQLSTFVITGSKENPQAFQIIDDINERVKIDETKLRIFNITSDKITFNISSGTYNNSGEVLYGSSTNYLQIPPDECRTEITLPDNTTQGANVMLNPGRIYTMYIAQNLDTTTQQKELLKFILVVDGNTAINKCIN